MEIAKGYYKTKEILIDEKIERTEHKDKDGNILFIAEEKIPIYKTEKEWVDYTEEEILDFLRSEREFECFKIINRGQPWYNKLTVEQKLELDKWYEQWLNVTETKVIPDKPSWLK